MLTANAFAEDVARYVAAGADGVLHKPVDIAALYALLSSVSEQDDGPQSVAEARARSGLIESRIPGRGGS
jgi:CheY-like chemotaxis protein